MIRGNGIFVIGFAMITAAIAAEATVTVFTELDRDDPAPAVTAHDNTRARAAYEELSAVVAQSRADLISAHDRISAIYWQLDVVLRTCPGQDRLPTPPWPVREPQWTAPWTPSGWDALYVRHVTGGGE